jgi:hypothetical protein
MALLPDPGGLIDRHCIIPTYKPASIEILLHVLVMISDIQLRLLSTLSAVQTKLEDGGVTLQPAMPVYLDKALQQQYAAARPAAGAQTLELTCLGQVQMRAIRVATQWMASFIIYRTCIMHCMRQTVNETRKKGNAGVVAGCAMGAVAGSPEEIHLAAEGRHCCRISHSGPSPPGTVAHH